MQAWDLILNGLEDNRDSVNLTTIDFAKAFNQMEHQACLRAFEHKGASSQTIGMIASFLMGRRMSVKVGNSMSAPRPIMGAAPKAASQLTPYSAPQLSCFREDMLKKTMVAPMMH